MTTSQQPAAWRWRLADADGREITALSAFDAGQEFPTRSDAESWVGENWAELAAEGVLAVTLLEGDREVYGPMSLEA